MVNTPFSIKKFKTTFTLVWVALFLIHALVLYWFGFSEKIAFADSFINNFYLLLFCWLLMNSLRFYIPQSSQYVNTFISCTLLALVWMTINYGTLKYTLKHEEGYTTFLKDSLLLRYFLGLLLLSMAAMVSIIWAHWQEEKNSEQRSNETDKAAREAELFNLRQRLQPHFLFNSLNSINALIKLRPDEARKMVQQLSDFLRGTVKKNDKDWTTIEEELQHLQLYLDIEKVRFGNRMQVIVAMEEAASGLYIPALLLQPLVENAIKFGLYDTLGDTEIKIVIKKKNELLVVQISNPFDPETSTPKKGTGFGLASIHRRLFLLFSQQSLLSTWVEETTYTAQVIIPQIYQPSKPI